MHSLALGFLRFAQFFCLLPFCGIGFFLLALFIAHYFATAACGFAITRIGILRGFGRRFLFSLETLRFLRRHAALFTQLGVLRARLVARRAHGVPSRFGRRHRRLLQCRQRFFAALECGLALRQLPLADAHAAVEVVDLGLVAALADVFQRLAILFELGTISFHFFTRCRDLRRSFCGVARRRCLRTSVAHQQHEAYRQQ